VALIDYLPYPKLNCIMDTNEVQLPEEQGAPETPTCAGCERPLSEQSGRTPICSECREQFIRYPVPNWIRLFGGAIVLLLAFGLTRLPAGLNAAVHHKRGERAMDAHLYVTAQKELEQAVKAQPSYLEANLRLLIAAYYNEDYATTARISQSLEGKKVDNEELYNEATGVLARLNRHYPSDSLQAFMAAQDVPADAISEASWQQYLKNNNDEDFVSFGRAASAIDRKEYALAQVLLHRTLATDPEYSRTLQMMVSLKREQGQYDSALFFADRLLAINRELASSYGAKARVLLKQKKDREAGKTVQEGLRFDPKDSYCLATLALVYHFQGDARGRDALILRAAKDSQLAGQFTYVTDIVSGKETFRN
jgi:tetratricopeptide (TPR) repeat protein